MKPAGVSFVKAAWGWTEGCSRHLCPEVFFVSFASSRFFSNLVSLEPSRHLTSATVFIQAVPGVHEVCGVASFFFACFILFDLDFSRWYSSLDISLTPRFIEGTLDQVNPLTVSTVSHATEATVASSSCSPMLKNR